MPLTPFPKLRTERELSALGTPFFYAMPRWQRKEKENSRKIEERKKKSKREEKKIKTKVKIKEGTRYNLKPA